MCADCEWGMWHTGIGSILQCVQRVMRRVRRLLGGRVFDGLEALGVCANCEWDTWRWHWLHFAVCSKSYDLRFGMSVLVERGSSWLL